MTKEEYIEKTKKIKSLKEELKTLEIETIIFEEDREDELMDDCSKFVGKVVKQDYGDCSVRYLFVRGMKRGGSDAFKPIYSTEVILVGDGITISRYDGQESIHIDSQCEIFVYDSVEKSHVTIANMEDEEYVNASVKGLLTQILGKHDEKE